MLASLAGWEIGIESTKPDRFLKGSMKHGSNKCIARRLNRNYMTGLQMPTSSMNLNSGECRDVPEVSSMIKPCEESIEFSGPIK